MPSIRKKEFRLSQLSTTAGVEGGDVLVLMLCLDWMSPATARHEGGRSRGHRAAASAPAVGCAARGGMRRAQRCASAGSQKYTHTLKESLLCHHAWWRVLFFVHPPAHP